jgi:hypothetical protein
VLLPFPSGPLSAAPARISLGHRERGGEEIGGEERGGEERGVAKRERERGGKYSFVPMRGVVLVQHVPLLPG